MTTVPLRLAVIIVGAALLVAVLLIGLLAFRGQPVPDVLQNIAVGALAGLLGLLVPAKQPPPR